MGAFFSSLSSMEKLFFVTAVGGGLLFVVRLIMMMIGGDGDTDADLGADGADLDLDHPDTDAGFRVLSIQGLTSFFMMFGLVGLALSRQTQVKETWALAGGIGAGAVTVWVIGRIFVGMKRLQSDGTMRPANAVGQEGAVYLTIHPGKTGQVRVACQGRLTVFDAIAEGLEEPLPTGTGIRVKKVVSGNVLVVEQL